MFPDIVVNYLNHDWLSERPILAVKNKDVNEINFKIQNQIVGPVHSFKSVDCVVHEATNYPTEFLNSFAWCSATCFTTKIWFSCDYASQFAIS